jgi:hypothetical protein
MYSYGYSYLKQGTVKRIHVDRRVIAQNRKNGTHEPTITVQTSKGPHKCRRAVVLGNGEMVQAGPVYSDEDGKMVRVIKPLGCGARVWFETRAAVEMIT